jgi:aminopeptidase N
MAPWWFPSNDQPRDKATYDISITTDAAKTVIANGEQVGDPVVSGDQATTHWRMKQPMATYLAFFAAGRFAVRQGTTAGIPWVAAVSKQFGPATRRTYLRLVRRSGAITAWLQRELGPYPFDSTGGLVTPLSAIPYAFALENQSRPTYQGGLDKITEVHELAHQWFGDAVSVHRWKDIWLNEGFASYMEHRWAEDHGGQTTSQWLHRDYRDLADAASFWQMDITDPGADINSQLFDTPVYERGALALAALRNRIGKHTFDRLLRDWAADHRYGSATVGMFERAAEKAAGHPLDRFFHAWLVADRPPRRTASNGF